MLQLFRNAYSSYQQPQRFSKQVCTHSTHEGGAGGTLHWVNHWSRQQKQRSMRHWGPNVPIKQAQWSEPRGEPAKYSALFALMTWYRGSAHTCDTHMDVCTPCALFLPPYTQLHLRICPTALGWSLTSFALNVFYHVYIHTFEFASFSTFLLINNSFWHTPHHGWIPRCVRLKQYYIFNCIE